MKASVRGMLGMHVSPTATRPCVRACVGVRACVRALVRGLVRASGSAPLPTLSPYVFTVLGHSEHM